MFSKVFDLGLLQRLIELHNLLIGCGKDLANDFLQRLSIEVCLGTFGES
jgi:hypothetical protein